MTKVHVANYSGLHSYKGWVRRAIDWKPPHQSGAGEGYRYVVGKELPGGLRHLDIQVDLDPGTVKTFDLSESEAWEGDAEVVSFDPNKVWPAVAGERMLVRSVRGNGAGIDCHWRTRIGSMLIVDLWGTVYPGQDWIEGKLQVHACNIDEPDHVAEVPPGFTLTFGEGTLAKGLHTGLNGEIIPEGRTIAAGQGLPAIPVVLALPTDQIKSAAAAAELSICAIAINELWPGLGNPLWHASSGSIGSWVRDNYGRVKRSLTGWQLTPHTFSSRAAQVSGGEPDQVFMGGELTGGTESLGADWVMWMRGASMARRPGMWSEMNGDVLRTWDRTDLALFESYPFTRGGSVDTLGFTGSIPNTLDTAGYWTWQEHRFYNALFVGYRVTGCPALQWQIERRFATWMGEKTSDSRFTTTNYTGADRGYGWECLEAWWLYHTLEQQEHRDLIRERWRWRWANVGKPRMTRPEFWPKFWEHDPTWFAWQKGAVSYFLDLCGEAFNEPEAREAAAQSARAVVENAYRKVDATFVPYGYVKLNEQGDVQLPLEDNSQPWGGVTGWMVTAAATLLRNDPSDELAQDIVKQDVDGGRLGGVWIPPDVIPR